MAENQELIYRVVVEKYGVLRSNSNRGGMYDSVGWVRNALRGFKSSWWARGKDMKVQYATVVWHDLQED